MKCEEAIRLIHLDGQEERSSAESAMLQVHLDSCERCASEAQLVGRTDRFLKRLRASNPVLAGPEDLSRAIINELARVSHESGSPPAQGTMVTLMDVLLKPAFRYGYAALVLFFLALFMITEADTLRSVDALSTRLARSTGPPQTDIRYSIPLKDAQDIVGGTQLEPLLANTPVRLSNDRLFIHKSEIEPWRSSLTGRLFTRFFSSSETPIEQLPAMILDLQKSVSYSLSLREKGDNK